MELMSSLLLCALAALLPPTLEGTLLNPSIKINNTKLIGQSHVSHKTIILNPAHSAMSTQNAFQYTFVDVKCKKCMKCMKKAVKSNQKHLHSKNYEPNTEELVNDVLGRYHQYKSLRHKRGAGNKGESTNIATTKSVKSKNSKSVTVSKYSTNGQVYALKIKEGNTASNGQESGPTCLLYSVKKYLPCESPEVDLMLIDAKKKASKKNKNFQAKKKSAHTTEPLPLEQISRAAKREVGSTRIMEQYMTSIEELY